MDITWRGRLELLRLGEHRTIQENRKQYRNFNISYLSNLAARNSFNPNDLTDFEKTFEEDFLLNS